MATVAYWDCFVGLTGTMALGALLDAGVPRAALDDAVRSVGIDGWTLDAARSLRASMAGTDARITLTDPDTTFDLVTLESKLTTSNLAPEERQRCLATATLVAAHTASATISQRSVIEIVGVVVGLRLLGVKYVYAALPAANESTERGQRVKRILDSGPLFDPVGAALMVTLARRGRPPMHLRTTGYGLANRGLPVLDAVRLWLGEGDGDVSGAPLMMEAFEHMIGNTQPTPAPPVTAAPPTARRPDATAPLALDALVLLDDIADAERTTYADLARTLGERMDVPVHVCGTHGRGTRATIEACMKAGQRRIVVAPLFRTPARRAIAELQGMVTWARGRWPDSTITITDPVWTPDHLLGTLQRHADATLATIGTVGDGTTALVVVAPGSGDEDDNAEWFRLGRLLWERRRADDATVDVCFSDTTQPDIATTLRRVKRDGAGRIVVLPATLFGGASYDAIVGQVEAARGSLGEHVAVAPPLARVAIAARLIAGRVRDALERPAAPVVHHGHTHAYTWDSALLPPRYQNGASVSAAPMSAADLVYDANGQVAWDAIWGDFCDLALAGGPPHRDQLLEPADPAAITADPVGYEHARSEIERGLRIVTGLPVVASTPGWIGVRCTDEEMVLWMLRAIIVENVSVRREGNVLLLPVGPDYRLGSEVKNVVTAVAKTHHYWMEHMRR